MRPKKEITYSVSALFDTDKICVTLDMKDEADGLFRKVSQEIINLKEQAIKDALISLGWTPPTNKP